MTGISTECSMDTYYDNEHLFLYNRHDLNTYSYLLKVSTSLPLLVMLMTTARLQHLQCI